MIVVDSEASNSEESVIQFNSKQIDDILNSGFPDIMNCIGNLKAQSHKV